MRPLTLFVSILCLLLFLTACGSEEELTPPAFSNIVATGTSGSTTILTAPSQDVTVTITGALDDATAQLSVDRTGAVKTAIAVDSVTGVWSLTFDPQEGVNNVIFTATDQRGNSHQLTLTVTHDTTAPVISKVTQDQTDPLNPKLLITFNELLLPGSVLTDSFDIDLITVSGATYDPTGKVVILPLTTALAAGTHTMTCGGITDLATPTGNSVTDIYTFTITIP